MNEELERILSQLTQPDNKVIQQATILLKQAFKDPAIIPALCAVMSNSQDPQIRQSAAVMLRLRVKKHWKKINPNDRESLKAVVLQAFMRETVHPVQHSLSQLCAVMVRHETPDRWPNLLELLSQSTKSSNPHDRQVGLLLLNKVVESNPESFKPHYRQLLQLFHSVLQDHSNPTALYYCILTLTSMTAYTGTDEMAQMRSIVPTLIVALKHLITADEDQAAEAMEILNELMESEVTIIVPHLAEIVSFCLEVGSDTSLTDSLRAKGLSCIAFLIKLKSKTILKQKLLSPIIHTIFPVLTATPPLGEQDPEDEEDDNGDGTDENPKQTVAQIIDTMALHMPPEKLFHHLLPLTQTCLTSQDPYQKKGGLMCLAMLAEGCADHIRTKMLSSVLQTVCQSLSDSNQVVRSAALFALGQFSEFLQPEITKYCAQLMPLLLGYISSLNDGKVGHVTKAFYALENVMENLGPDIEPYLPTLMDTMLSALNNTNNLKIKELAVSAIGAIASAAKELLVPYFPPVIESLKGFLTTTTEEMRSLQTQSLDTLAELARTIGKDVFSPLAGECVKLGLNLMNTDDPDLRRCTYTLYSAVSTVSPDCLIPHLSKITTIMLLALKSNEGITAHLEEDKTFVLLDDDDNDEDDDDHDKENKGEFLGDEEEVNVHEYAGFSVENAYIDEKEDACDALGEISFNTGVAFQPFMESSFEQVYDLRDFPHEDVRKAAYKAMGQFCRAQHKVWEQNPTETNYQALLKLLDVVLPCFMESVRKETERQVVMAVLEAMNSVIKACKEKAFTNPNHLRDISSVIIDVLRKKTVCQDSGGDEADDEEQAEYDAMLQEFAGEGVPLLTSSVPAESFAPYLTDLLTLIIPKAKSSCTVADRSFSVGTIGEVLHALVSAPGGRAVASRLSNRLRPVLINGVRDSDPEVRSNSVFGLGCMAQAAGPSIVSEYPTMLSVFSNMLSKESDLRVIDNVCAALCRMIMSNIEAVPLEQVVPAVVGQLPLKEDMEENKTVFSCLNLLYKHSPLLIVKLMKPIVSAASRVVVQKNKDIETQNTLVTLLKDFAQNNSGEFRAAMTSLPAEQQAHLTATLATSSPTCTDNQHY